MEISDLLLAPLMRKAGLEAQLATPSRCSLFDPWGPPHGFGGCVCTF